MKKLTAVLILILASACGTFRVPGAGLSLTGNDPLQWVSRYKIEDARAASATAMQHDPPDPLAAQC